MSRSASSWSRDAESTKTASSRWCRFRILPRRHPPPRPNALLHRHLLPSLSVLSLAVNSLSFNRRRAGARGASAPPCAYGRPPCRGGGGAAAGPVFSVKDLPGITDPLGFFDPLGYCTADGVTEGKVRFYREAELKHGRVAMLAALGFLVGEQFHPLWGGNIDVPSYVAFQETPLQTFFFPVVLSLAVFEIFSVFTFNTPQEGVWTIKSTHEPGNMGFDPLGLKPTDPAELEAMQTKELNNGRLAMIGIAAWWSRARLGPEALLEPVVVVVSAVHPFCSPCPRERRVTPAEALRRWSRALNLCSHPTPSTPSTAGRAAAASGSTIAPRRVRSAPARSGAPRRRRGGRLHRVVELERASARGGRPPRHSPSARGCVA